MSVLRLFACCSLLMAAACSGEREVSETPEYQGGYEEGYNDGYEEAKAEYSSKIEDALAALNSARVELDEAEYAAQQVANEAERFGFDDWQMVVGDVQIASLQAVSETADVDRHLDEAESALND